MQGAPLKHKAKREHPFRMI